MLAASQIYVGTSRSSKNDAYNFQEAKYIYPWQNDMILVGAWAEAAQQHAQSRGARELHNNGWQRQHQLRLGGQCQLDVRWGEHAV